MKTKLILAMLCLAAISGCAVQPSDSKAELLFAQNAFLRTVNTLTILRDAGKFDDADVQRIKALVNSGDRLLDKWTDAVLGGEYTLSFADAFDSVLTELISYKERP